MSPAMTSIQIPQDVLMAARLTEQEFKIEVAIHLYSTRRLSIGKARELAGLPLWQFRQILAARQIPAHYDVEDLEADVRTLRAMDRL